MGEYALRRADRVEVKIGTCAADRRWWDSVTDRVLAGAQLVQAVAR